VLLVLCISSQRAEARAAGHGLRACGELEPCPQPDLNTEFRSPCAARDSRHLHGVLTSPWLRMVCLGACRSLLSRVDPQLHQEQQLQ
jgi:hypothetical protein